LIVQIRNGYGAINVLKVFIEFKSLFVDDGSGAAAWIFFDCTHESIQPKTG